jgi:hypothetical protein
VRPPLHPDKPSKSTTALNFSTALKSWGRLSLVFIPGIGMLCFLPFVKCQLAKYLIALRNGFDGFFRLLKGAFCTADPQRDSFLIVDSVAYSDVAFALR